MYENYVCLCVYCMNLYSCLLYASMHNNNDGNNDAKLFLFVIKALLLLLYFYTLTVNARIYLDFFRSPFPSLCFRSK